MFKIPWHTHTHTPLFPNKVLGLFTVSFSISFHDSVLLLKFGQFLFSWSNGWGNTVWIDLSYVWDVAMTFGSFKSAITQVHIFDGEISPSVAGAC